MIEVFQTIILFFIVIADLRKMAKEWSEIEVADDEDSKMPVWPLILAPAPPAYYAIEFAHAVHII